MGHIDNQFQPFFSSKWTSFFLLVICFFFWKCLLFDSILNSKPRKLIPQRIAEPENAFQVQNCHIFLAFLLILGFFSINFFIFGSFSRLFVSLYGHFSLIIHVLNASFLPRCNLVFIKFFIC